VAIALSQTVELPRPQSQDAFIRGREGGASPFVCEILAGNQYRTADSRGIEVL
jgi:hypothetical protein